MTITIHTLGPTPAIVLRAPRPEDLAVSAVMVVVVLPDGREARLRVDVYADERGTLHASMSGLRQWRGKPTCCTLALTSKDYTDPETGALSVFRRALDGADESAQNETDPPK